MNERITFPSQGNNVAAKVLPKHNSSLNLKYIAEEIARIKHVSYETVVDVTRENAKRMYQISMK